MLGNQSLPEARGGARHTDPLRGRCVPVSRKAVASTFQVVLGVGPAFDDAPHHLPLAFATGRVSFSDGDPCLSHGSGWLPKYPFGSVRRPEWQPSLGFTATGLTWDLRPGYDMSDSGWPDSLSSARTCVTTRSGPLHIQDRESFWRLDRPAWGRAPDPTIPPGWPARRFCNAV